MKYLLWLTALSSCAAVGGASSEIYGFWPSLIALVPVSFFMGVGLAALIKALRL